MLSKNSYEKAFSINVRKLRKKLNMTQKSLADAIGYSEKTVSKWETEGSVPPIEALFKIASIFRVNITDLFRCDESVYYLGIDIGCTGRKIGVVTEHGIIIQKKRIPRPV